MSKIKSLLRRATGAPRGYINEHFNQLKGDVNTRLDVLGHEIGVVRDGAVAQQVTFTTAAEKVQDSVGFLGTQLARVIDAQDELRRTADDQRELLVQLEKDIAVIRARPAPSSAADLDDRQLELLNFNASHRGYAAQDGLWLNPPLHVAYSGDGAYLAGVNERVAEHAFVFRALAGMASGARVLDVGACESIVAFSLASLGYRVVALDPRPYPLAHPSLQAVQTPIEEYDDAQGFDAVVVLSTVEHIGVGAYDLDGRGNDADLLAMKAVRRLLKPGGVLALTTPFGHAAIDELERTYDADGIRRLVGDFTIERVEVAVRTSPTTWEHEADHLDIPLDDRTRVVMITAR